jgi:large subunit ribosomal protein L9
MKIILTDDVHNLGNKGDVVEVAKGYARNYLLPRNFAILATKGAQKQAELLTQSRQTKQSKLKVEAEEIAKKLESLVVEVAAKSRDGGKLFGSVGPQNIAIAINEQVETFINKSQVTIEAPIKEVGEYTANVVLHEEITQEIKITVVAQ